MWKRDNETAPAGSAPSPAPAFRNDPEPPPARSGEAGGRAVIGPSIQVKGELTGSEDLLIEGRVEGKIGLAQNALTVGTKGRVTASVHARAIHVEGEVEGDLTAEELILLRKSARVRGDLTAPRVVIEDGARFKGAIDMEAKKGAAATPRPAPVAEAKPAETPAKLA